MFQRLRSGVYLQLRTVFSDAVRQKRLDNAIQYTDPNAKAAVPITWNADYVTGLVAPLRRKLRAVDFVIEVRDARIPVSTLHPQLRAWAGKKPRVMVLNKADLISHRDKVEWDRHFEQKNIQVRSINGDPDDGISITTHKPSLNGSMEHHQHPIPSII